MEKIIDKIVNQQVEPSTNVAWLRRDSEGDFELLIFYKGEWRKINNAVENT